MQPLKNDFYINEWHVHPRANRLSRKGNTIHVEPKVMQVLVFLAERAGDVVTRDELMGAVWEETIIHEDVLSRSISELRKIFGDQPRNPEYIETIHKTGYRLIAPVSYAESDRTRIWTTKSFIGSILICLLFIAGFSLLYPFGEASRENLPLESRPVTTYSGREVDPAFSPDGNQLAFARDKGTGQFDLYIKVIGSERAMQLTDHPARDIAPAWSPDGRQIAFVRTDGENCGIHIVPVTGGMSRKLVECTEWDMVQPKWMPWGNRLIYTDRESVHNPFRIISLPTETLETKYIDPVPADSRGNIYPALSPDATRLAFVRWEKNGELTLNITSPGSGDVQLLTNEKFSKILDLEWMPDGRHLVFTGFRDDRFGLWKVSAEGGDVTWYPTGMEDLIDLTVHHSKQIFAYEKRMSDDNIWHIALTGPAPSPLQMISSTRWDSKPRYSPTGSQIAFQSTRSGQHEIWLADSDGGNPVQLTSLNNAGTRDPVWSPDGNRIGFSTNAGESTDLYSIGIDRGIPEQLTDHPADERDLQWSTDGETIHYRSNRSGGWDIWKQHLASSRADRITQSGDISYFKIHNSTIFYTRTNLPGVWKTVADGGEPIKLMDEPSPSASRNWTAAESGIYFARVGSSSPSMLSYYDFESEKITDLAPLDRLSVFSGLSLSPDRNYLIYARTDKSESDIILVEHFE